LHGHSYTAHAVGCHVANTSLKEMMELETKGKWDEYKADWRDDSLDGLKITNQREGEVPVVWSVWSKDFIQKASNRREVESVVALGSVLAISLHDKQAGKLPVLNPRNPSSPSQDITLRLLLGFRGSCCKARQNSMFILECLGTFST
jgi:hypothetical protein